MQQYANFWWNNVVISIAWLDAPCQGESIAGVFGIILAHSLSDKNRSFHHLGYHVGSVSVTKGQLCRTCLAELRNHPETPLLGHILPQLVCFGGIWPVCQKALQICRGPWAVVWFRRCSCLHILGHVMHFCIDVTVSRGAGSNLQRADHIPSLVENALHWDWSHL